MSRKPRGNIHKIREFELEKINLVDEFDILQIVGEGWFGKILLVEHRASQTEMVLKAVPKPYVSLRDFYREFHYGLHLGIHRNIVTTYDVAFETAGFFVFTQEYAPLGDLTSNITETGVGEVYSKRVAKQIASALDYMHTKDIVHRDVKLDNILIYRSDFSRVKLCDFGESYQTGFVVERRNEWLPYSPPEVLEIKPEGTYKADPTHDVWQFGIVIFVCLTGCLPWQKAASDDPRYVRYLAWHGTMMLAIRRTPKLFKLLSSRAQRMFRRLLEPRSDRRPKNFTDIAKFLDDRWLAKTAEREMAEYETDELCPSMYSFHSSPDEKHRLLYTLADCGIETNVDRQTKKNRIKDWIESSVITEEDEEENEESASASPSSSLSREPVPGHISSIRQTTDKAKEIKSTLKDATQKHFDPRTGALQQGPSEMGGGSLMYQKSISTPLINNGYVPMTNNGNESLNSSLLVIDSRQDLAASGSLMYGSDVNLNQLGKHKNTDRFLYQSLSSSDLLTANAADAEESFYFKQRQMNLFTQQTFSGGQSSDVDPVASTLDIDSLYAKAMSPAAKNKSPNFIGIANATQMLAQIPLTAGHASALYQQPHEQTFHNQSSYRRQNNSQVKDSAYGSTEVYENSLIPLPAHNAQMMNGNKHSNHQQTQTQAVFNMQAQQSYQQQQPINARDNLATSMKDTAYDRVLVTSNGKKKR